MGQDFQFAIGIIRKIGNQWCVVSHKTGKKLGCFDTKEKAMKHLRRVQFFKSQSIEIKREIAGCIREHGWDVAVSLYYKEEGV